VTDDEAAKVAELIAKADGGCPYCVAILIGQARSLFPEHNWRRLVRRVNPKVLEFPDSEAILTTYGTYRERVRASLEHSRERDS
jgi:hypothetical protein